MRKGRLIATVDEYRSLDEAEILIGYMEAFENAPRPGSTHSRGYEHGWRTAMIELGRLRPAKEDQLLAAAFEALATTHSRHN